MARAGGLRDLCGYYSLLALSPAPPVDGHRLIRHIHVGAFLVLSVLADLPFPEEALVWPATACSSSAGSSRRCNTGGIPLL